MKTDALLKIAHNPAIKNLCTFLGRDAELHLVGGCVRDCLMGIEPKDIDLATKLSPEEVCKRLKAKDVRCDEVGIRRGTVVVFLFDESFEITTFRNPENEKEASHSIEIDLQARDFTINAIAFSLETLELVDPYNGLNDLNGPLRTVKNAADRFNEDPHRILRMIRFGPGQGREVSESLLKSAKELVDKLAEVNSERLYPELRKIMVCKHPKACLELMHELGILEIILPELNVCKGFAQNKHHSLDVFDHITSVIEATSPRVTLRLAALFHDIGKPQSLTINENGDRQFIGHEEVSEEVCKSVLRRWKAPTSDIEDVSKLVALHMKSVEMGKPKIRKLLSLLGPLFQDWMDLKHADMFGGSRAGNIDVLEAEWVSFCERVRQINVEPPVHRLSDLEITGDHLIKVIGLKPGPKFKKILNHLHELVLEDPSQNKLDTLLCEVNHLVLFKSPLLED